MAEVVFVIGAVRPLAENLSALQFAAITMRIIYRLQCTQMCHHERGLEFYN